MSGRSDYQILIIEDTPEFARLTTMTLERFGFQTHHVGDGEAALAYVETARPSLILLDLNLPDLSGWQVLERMKAKHSQIPIVVTTAYSDSANRVVGKLQDVYKYLVKPFQADELISVLDEALGIVA